MENRKSEDVQTTEIQTETFTFVWHLPKYAVLLNSIEGNSKNKIISPIFVGPKNGHGHDWELHIQPTSEACRRTNRREICLKLTKFGESDGASRLMARFQFRLLDTKGTVMSETDNVLTSELYEFVKDGVFSHELSHPLFITNCKHFSQLEDEFTIHCHVLIEGGLRHFTGSPVLSSARVGNRSKLQANINILRGVGTDVTICTETKTFSAHEAVLTAQSPYFHSMLCGTMLEARQKKFNVPNFSEKVIKAMLHFIYTGETVDLKANAIELLKLSDQYDLKELKAASELAIAGDLTVANAIDALVLAKTYNAPILKNKVLQYIKEGNI